MRIPVEAPDGQQFVTCQPIGSAPVVTARQWSELLSVRSNSRQLDTVELVDSAISKWCLYSTRGRVAGSRRQLVTMIDQNPKIDVLATIEAQAPWSDLGRRVGICQFRRTWSNSIAIDFLAVHPALLADVDVKPISGVGTAMLYAVARLAREIRAERVWLETTDLSVGYYQYLFGSAVDNDLMIASTEDFYALLHKYFKEP